MELIISISVELPFWMNIRSGEYPIERWTRFGEELSKRGIQNKILNSVKDNVVKHTLIVENFKWKIGIDDINFEKHFTGVQQKNYDIFVIEDHEKREIVSDSLLNKYFGANQKFVSYKKIKTEITIKYHLTLNDFRGKDTILAISDVLKDDSLKAINEFISIYTGFFSTINWSNDASIVGPSIFTQENTRIQLTLDGKDMSSEFGFPMSFFNSGRYPAAFPSFSVEKLFFDYLDKNIKPSFSKILKGFSNHFFDHGDVRIGILFLNMSLESCIESFIEYFNNKNEKGKKLKELSKNYSLGDFLKGELESVINDILNLDPKEYIDNINKFYNH